MTKLLKANFYKLVKEKSIYTLMLVSACIALLLISVYFFFWSSVSSGAFSQGINAETLFLNGVQLGQNIGIIMSIGVTLYIGKEFSQNTIRNKIAIGHSKKNIYFSNLIMSILIVMIVYLSYEVFVFAIGVPLFGWNESFSFGELAKQLVNSFFILLAFSSVLNMISMLSRSLVAGMLIGIFSMVFGVVFFAAIQVIPLEGGVKSFFDMLTRLNFIGQSILMPKINSISFMIQVLISSVVISLSTTVVGAMLFEKMDIK